MKSQLLSGLYSSTAVVALSFGAVRTVGAQGSRTGGNPADTARVVTINREVFHYSSGGRRDPFKSLLTTTELKPTVADLRLTTVAYDPTGRNSVAVLRDVGTKEQYRVKVGSALGRMRVVRIDPKVVTFAIEEFGFSRQETLTLGDSTRTRTP